MAICCHLATRKKYFTTRAIAYAGEMWLYGRCDIARGVNFNGAQEANETLARNKARRYNQRRSKHSGADEKVKRKCSSTSPLSQKEKKKVRIKKAADGTLPIDNGFQIKSHFGDES